MRLTAGRRLATALLALPFAAALAGCGGDGHAATPPPHITSSATAPAPSGTAAPAAMPASVPVRVAIPAAGVDTAPLLRLGLNDDGTIEVPSVPQADRIGWYDKGVTPGENGPAVLVGHFDTVNGPAVMKDVGKIEPGDTITVTREDGTRAVFAVTALEQVDKDAFPTDKVYGRTDRPELRLITCGGEITDGHRPDNIIVYAGLVG
ncbi:MULTISPECIES: class F sortase [Streptomyces]|uniref:Class F sortase n=1 Tax=Streptomyces violaceolatus TaxID=67378 RepID=A0ABN3SNL2_9ACTN|nr:MULTISPECIES: class F sortase [Streptomyces]REH21141.1 sortase family protein [Streptomyces sp. 2221.1]WSB63162.1 class F sortase [Streptomyces anthocyanicus]SDT45597.1 Sortase family protein [Streptomyces sp. 2114.2]